MSERFVPYKGSSVISALEACPDSECFSSKTIFAGVNLVFFLGGSWEGDQSSSNNS